MVKTELCNLPREVVELIFFRLTSFADRVRFRSVCRWLRSFLPIVADCSSPPYLYYTRSNKIFSITENRTYYLQHDFFGHDEIICSSNGWLVLVDSEADVSMFNPFSGAQASLPALWSLPGVEAKRFDHINDAMVWYLKSEGCEIGGGENLRRRLLMSMSVSPTMTSMIVYNDKLAFAGPYSQYWSEITIPPYFPEDAFTDVVYHDADHKFYAISEAGATLSICQQLGSVETIVPYDNILPGDYINPQHGVPYIGPSIVSLGGELLCIFILLFPSKITKLSFDIRKLARENGKTARWVRAESLDDWTIFLDSNGACARGGGTNHNLGYKPNCIYFNFNHKRRGRRVIYNGIFDITEKNIKPIYDTKHSCRCALWIEPPKYA